MRLPERIEAAITSSKNAHIEQSSIPIAVQEPVLHRTLERQIGFFRELRAAIAS
jgi:hypothetical protein